MDAYNALTGEDVTDLTDPRIKEAADAIGAAQTCGDANRALAKALDEALQALKPDDGTGEAAEYIDGVRDSVASKIAASGGSVAELSDLLRDVRATLDSMRNAGEPSDSGDGGEDDGTGGEVDTGSEVDTGGESDAGSEGSTGGEGSTGSEGDTGNEGGTGSEGGTDSESDAGSTGSTGDSDNTGNTGSTGSTGNTGNTGGTGGAGTSGVESAKKVEFERAKSELLSEAEKLVREHDGEQVIEMYMRRVGTLRDTEFSEERPDESLEELQTAFEDVKRETEQAQRLQRFENSARAELEAAVESGKFDAGELDALLAEYMELACGLPSQGKDGDPQSDIEELYGRFLSDLAGLQESRSVSPWWLAAGAAALGAAAVIAVPLTKRGKHEKKRVRR